MPELPEVEHAARSLGAQITGRRIVAITKLDWERMVEAPSSDRFRELIQGRMVGAVGRRAKWIVMTLDDGWTLALHLRMSGALTVHSPADSPDRHTHLVLLLDDHRQVFFHDTRKFGRVRLLDATGLAALDTAHGIEPLTAAFTPARLGALLHQRHTHLKPLLLDQRVIAGIGNIYADEALWNARLHPLRPSDSLTDDEIARLHAGVRQALLQGIEHGGSTLRDYRNGYGQAGSHQQHFNAYDRQGQPCRRCGTPIEKTVVAQRGTHVCPHCQPQV
ncbi:MAG: bifunctional DNA-formamidopyrimidine glycosylase/DNA-(apurinic or apyrimidinic site) lyase [Kouleothrix sp.]|jgi:formamidopyrimidine-DNA glycosylase|nr:bifunctional DNA-formamidopyrimidine glycosylase/DNA-(apurinic or apyrimidinic site) lyase [Kouleothrix sp.]